MAIDTSYRPAGMLAGRCLVDHGTSPVNRYGNAFDLVAQPLGTRMVSVGEDVLSSSYNRIAFALANNADYLSAIGVRCAARPYLLHVVAGGGFTDTIELGTELADTPVFFGTSVADCGMVVLSDDFMPIMKTDLSAAITVDHLDNSVGNNIWADPANQVLYPATDVVSASRYYVELNALLPASVYPGAVITLSSIDVNFPAGTTYDGTYLITKVESGATSKVWLGPKFTLATDRPSTYPDGSDYPDMRAVYEAVHPFITWDESYNDPMTYLAGASATISCDGLFMPNMKVVLTDAPPGTSCYLLLGMADYAAIPSMSGGLDALAKLASRSGATNALVKDLVAFEPELADAAAPALPDISYQHYVTPCIIQGSTQYPAGQRLVAYPGARIRREFSKITKISVSLTDLNALAGEADFVEELGAMPGDAVGVLQMAVYSRLANIETSAFEAPGSGAYTIINTNEPVSLGTVGLTAGNTAMTSGGADFVALGVLPGDTIRIIDGGGAGVDETVVALKVEAATITLTTGWVGATDSFDASAEALYWKTLLFAGGSGGDFTLDWNVPASYASSMTQSDFAVALKYETYGGALVTMNCLNLAVNYVLVEGERAY